MDILERIKERGYEVMKADYDDVDNPYAFNYARVVIKTPTENGWCLLENGFDLKSKSVFGKAETQLGLKSYKTEEEGTSVENESTIKFLTHFVNGEAYLTVLNGEYVVQLFHQADIDCFITDTFVFNHEPTLEEFHVAYDLMQFKVYLMCKRIKEIDGEMYWFEQLRRYKDLLGNAYSMLVEITKN